MEWRIGVRRDRLPFASHAAHTRPPGGRRRLYGVSHYCGNARAGYPATRRGPLKGEDRRAGQGVMAMNVVKTFAAVLLALGVLATASVALADRTGGRGEQVEAPASQQVQAR